MSKPVKAMITRELKSRYTGIESACVVDMTGMNVHTQERLRRSLRERSASLHVVKNSLARHALKDTPLAPLGNALEGPCALITSSQSLIDVAKMLVEASREFTALKLKYAVFDGDPTLLSVEQLARLRGKRELLGESAMLIASPGRRIAGALCSPQAKIAGCLKALVERGEASAAA
ncbi:MAG: 50S ribosomal protein L10 [Planctomycetes bacterium]|nr:50S ribosomal protein L10 [Planctomycetota bacterium]